MKIATDIEITGLEKLPHSNFIIAANHLGRLDTAVLLCVIDREDIIMAIAEKYKNHPIFGALGRAANGIWLNRFEVDHAAMRQILERMKQGGLLVLAPEGTRSKTEALQEGKTGDRVSSEQNWLSSFAGGRHWHRRPPRRRQPETLPSLEDHGHCWRSIPGPDCKRQRTR